MHISLCIHRVELNTSSTARFTEFYWSQIMSQSTLADFSKQGRKGPFRGEHCHLVHICIYLVPRMLERWYCRICSPLLLLMTTPAEFKPLNGEVSLNSISCSSPQATIIRPELFWASAFSFFVCPAPSLSVFNGESQLYHNEINKMENQDWQSCTEVFVL